MFAFTVEFSPCYILVLGFISILIYPIRKQIQDSFITCLCSHITGVAEAGLVPRFV